MTDDRHRSTTQTASGPGRRTRAAWTRERERDERRARALRHDARFDRLRSLAARRALVVLGYLLLLTASAMAWADPEGFARGPAPGVFLLGIGVAFVLRRTVRNAVDAPDSALDERLIAVRDAAHRSAFMVVTWAMLGVLMALILAQASGPHHFEALFYAFGLGAMLTPTAIMAWRERDV
jgi:hypothetical protein